MTRVISVRKQDRLALQADPNFVYVGRAVGRAGWRKSDWANPFMASRYADPVELYERRLLKGSLVQERFTSRMGFYEIDFGKLQSRIGELRGKTLGCWCCNWRPGEPIVKPCHAIILAKFADS